MCNYVCFNNYVLIFQKRIMTTTARTKMALIESPNKCMYKNLACTV